MEIFQIDVLLRLIIAHLLGDFIFQSDRIVRRKKDGLASKYFYFHILTIGLLTYLLLAQWHNWWAPVLIMIIHGAIDLMKIKAKMHHAVGYLTDQALHLLSIVFVWMLITNQSFKSIWEYAGRVEFSSDFLVIMVAYLLISVPTSVLIGQLTTNWQGELSDKSDDGLSNAGKWIGIIERVLILTFILIGQWMPIGFLLAGKSVFRFGDLNRAGERKKTEYILIGTFLSFTFAILIGILTFQIVSDLKIF